MRINLMDGSLNELGGHPHDIDLRCTQALVDAGHDVHIYCHLNATDKLQSCYQSIAAITPLFTIHPYRSQQSYDAVAGDIIKNLEGCHITANELLKVRDADLWLWPTLYAYQLFACSITKTRVQVSGCIHHPPDFFSPADAAWWRYAFIQAHNSRLKLRLGTIEPETAHIYAPLITHETLPVLPFPYDGVASAVKHTHVKTIGVFGYQRHEKGGEFLLTLLKKLAGAGFQVIFHDSNPLNTDLGNMQGIRRLGYIPNLDEEIARCDLVLTPYLPEAYKYRCSGIVMSALASGIPVVAADSSAPGRLVEKTGAGTLFTHYSLESVYAAVQTAVKNYPAIAEAARKTSHDWKQQHGIVRFIDAMIR